MAEISFDPPVSQNKFEERLHSKYSSMKKVSILLITMLLTANSFAQQTKTTIKLTSKDYLAKSKRQNTKAWIMLSSGVALFYTGFTRRYGFVTIGSATGTYVKNSDAIWMLAMAIGTINMVSSIPLFIASRRNKTKGLSTATFNLKPEKVIVPNIYPVNQSFYTALSIKIVL